MIKFHLIILTKSNQPLLKPWQFLTPSQQSFQQLPLPPSTVPPNPAALASTNFPPSMAAAPGSVSAPDLSSSLISFQTIKLQAKQTLIDIFESAPCPQALIVDPVLTNPISLICPVKEMKEHKIQEILLLGGREHEKTYQSFHSTFLIRPDPDILLQVKNIIFYHRKRIQQQQQILSARDPAALSQRTTFSIYFVPRRSLIAEHFLHNYGLTTDNDVSINEYPLDLIPCDNDLLSLEAPAAFPRIFIDGDTTILYNIALSVIRLQVLFGIIPIIKGVGRASHRVAELIHRISCELLTTAKVQQLDFGGDVSDPTTHESHSAESISFNSFHKSIRPTSQQASDVHAFPNSLTSVLQPQSRSNTLEATLASPSAPVSALTLLQQQKQSLSSHLSSLLSATSSSTPDQITTAPESSNLAEIPPMFRTTTDISKPRHNAPYNLNPIINSYMIPQITQVLFIDRTADMISPMLIQRTYEGLLDEMYGINTQTIEYDPPSEATGPDGKAIKSAPNTPLTPSLDGKKKKKMSLHSGDILFREFRDINIKILGPMFSEKWSTIKRTYAETEEYMSPGTAQIQVSEMERVVKKFKNVHIEHQLLPIHWHLAQQIKDFFASKFVTQLKTVEEHIFTDNDPVSVEKWIDIAIMKCIPLDKLVRVLILFSSVYGTINRKRSDLLRREICLSYGPETIPLLLSLQHLGVLFHTTPISDDVLAHQYMSQYTSSLLMARTFGVAASSNQPALKDSTQQIIDQTKPSVNNELNLHILTHTTGNQACTPLYHKPLIDTIFPRLKVTQTEQQLLTTQQLIYSKQQSNTTGNTKMASIQTLLRDPIDINYGYGHFYSPLSIRFVEMAAQSHGLRKLEDHLHVHAAIFTAPNDPSNTSSSLFTSSSPVHPLTTSTQTSSQIVPTSTSPLTPVISNPGQSSVNVATGSINDSTTVTVNNTITTPALFEYRQELPQSIQQRMASPDPRFFQYPLLASSTCPQTADVITAQGQFDQKRSQFMLSDRPTNKPNDPVQPEKVDKKDDKKGDQSLEDVDLHDDSGKKSIKPICLVYFIGGATPAEIGMLRYLTDSPNHRYAYVVATTKLTNARTIINDLQKGTTEIGGNFD